jgi:hypothetical protein
LKLAHLKWRVRFETKRHTNPGATSTTAFAPQPAISWSQNPKSWFVINPAIDLVRRSEFGERLVSPPEVAEADIIPYIRISLMRSAISAPDKRPSGEYQIGALCRAAVNVKIAILSSIGRNEPSALARLLTMRRDTTRAAPKCHNREP